MKKLFLIVVSFVFISFSAQARYVRKVREPDFFIPESYKMHQQEKLPLIKNKNKIEKKSVKKEEKLEVPDYKNKYSEYMKDISLFSKEKKMPENKALETDLSAMATGDIFEVTDIPPEKEKTAEQKDFNKIVAKILED